jgi:hypothetical protein
MERLVGFRVTALYYAADMRSFAFESTKTNADTVADRWYLHINCPWRLVTATQLITGRYDWYCKADLSVPENWDGADGASLQDFQLRQVFHDAPGLGKEIVNNTSEFIIETARVDDFGGLVISFSGGYRLEVFPSGSHGEYWRLLKNGDLESHVVSHGLLPDDE